MGYFLFISIGLVLGMFFPIQAALSSRLNKAAKNPLIASFTAFLIGTLILAGLNLGFNPLFYLQLVSYQKLPWYLLLGGGLTGIGYNLLTIILFRKIGASLTTVLTLTGQMAIGLIIDHFSLFNAPLHPLSLTRVLGVLIMGAGIIFTQLAETPSESDKGISGWLVLGTLGGFLPPLQQVINSQLSQAIASPLGAALISFFIGLLIITIVILISQKNIIIPRLDLSGQPLPLMTYSSGGFGVLIVTGNILLLPWLGSVVTTMVFLLGQLLMSLIIDQFGLFCLPKRQVTLKKLITLFATLIGIALVKFF